MTFSLGDASLIGICLEGFLYGLYTGIFIMYLQHEASEEGTNWKKNILFFLMCALYVSSLAVVVFDTTTVVNAHSTIQILESTLHIYYVQGTLSGCCDFLAQSILIFRCWIVWRRDIRVVIIPSVFAIAYLAIWLVGISASYIVPGSQFILTTEWGDVAAITGLAMSLAVNALVTGLIVFRIFQMFRQVRPTLENKTLGATGGRELWSIILVLIESGMALFSIQLARIVVSVVPTETALIATDITIAIHQMLNGITPTIILVRVSMGFSFHDEQSLVETVGSLRFASSNPNLNPEMDSIGRDDDVGVEQNNHMDVVEVER